jgi:hypothetical protein
MAIEKTVMGRQRIQSENRIDAESENISGARRLYSHVSQAEDLSFWPGGEKEDGAEGDDEASFGMLFDYYVLVVATAPCAFYLSFISILLFTFQTLFLAL